MMATPAKNGTKLIPQLLNSPANQDYPKMPNTKILVADEWLDSVLPT
jgi:glycosyltransferase involved in cell wall biosynthesis